MTTVAFLGTGTMGAPMVRNLLDGGFEVRAWNRTRAKAEPLAAEGATVAADPADAARGAEILVTMLLDSAATVEAARLAVTELDEGTPWLQMGTIGLSGLNEAVALSKHLRLVDAPVLGTRGPAEQGTLIVLAAGAHSVRGQAQPVFDSVGERTIWLDEDAASGAGTRLKLVINSWVLALNNAVGESFALADTLGVSPQHFLDAIKGTGTDSPYAHLKGAAIQNNEFTPAFALDAAYKDAQLIEKAAAHQVHLDMAEAVRERLRRAAESGHGGKDMAAAYFASFPAQHPQS